MQAAARGREPVRPAGHVDFDHWATVGGAFGQRLAFLISHETPRPALLGAANAGLDPELVDAFTAHLADYLTAHAPPGRLAATRDAEVTLARACWVLTGWEDAYRGKGLPAALARAHRDTCPLYGDPEIADACVQLLMLETPVPVVDELVTLAGRLHGSGTLGQLHALAGNPPLGTPLGVAGPVFVEHWADGDIVVGDTLIDVKTVITLRDRERIARWVYQLLAYAWLDEHDRYRIRNVGLYLARHGALVTWPLQEFAETLVDLPGCTAPARREFLGYAHDAMAREGATPPEQSRIA